MQAMRVQSGSPSRQNAARVHMQKRMSPAQRQHAQVTEACREVQQHTASSTAAPRLAMLVVVSSALASRLPLPSKDIQQWSSLT